MHRTFGLLLLCVASCKLPDLEKPDRLIDLDEDGFTEVENDCAPNDPTIHPGAEDVCDGADNDCNDEADDQFDVTGGDPFWADVDGDGWGDPNEPHTACYLHEGYAAQAGDCNDTDGAVHPQVADPCNDVDDDCDGVKDENGENIHWLDEDDDGFGDPAIPWCGSGTPPTTHVTNPDDCDDHDNLTFPGADERCDQKDNDCDNVEDEDAIDAITLCLDSDDDGLGDPEQTLEVCVNPGGDWEFDCTDCDDGDITVGATRTWYSDSDSDTYGDSADTAEVCDAPSSPPAWVLRGGDCMIEDPEINPGELETCRNGVDDDCDVATDCRFPQGWRLTGGTLPPDLRVEGTTALDRIGSSLYSADIDDDGYSEAMVAVANIAGAAEIAVVQGAEGQDGDIAELDNIRKTTFAPADGKGSASFGDAFVALDDIDADGFREVVAGDPGANDVSLGNPTGSAYVFWSDTGILTPPKSGEIGTPWPQWAAELRIDGTAAGDEFGTRIVRTPGFRTDLLAFAVSAPGNTSDDGAVYVVRLSEYDHSSGVNTTANADDSLFIEKYTGPAGLGSRFGTGLAFFHGPSQTPSLAIGATLAPELGDGGDALDGALYIFRLPTDDATVPSNATNAAVKIYGFTDGLGGFGANVINAGDVNGDGTEDLAVAAPTYRYEGILHRGKVYLLSGAIPDGTILRIENISSAYFIGGFIGPESDAALGASLAAGDVDGDGYDDLLFGAPLLNTTGEDAGAAWMVYGRPEPYGIVELGTGDLSGGTRFHSTIANDHLGQGLGCGDVDGDGFDDVMIGSPQFDPGALRQNAGAVYLLYGNGP